MDPEEFKFKAKASFNVRKRGRPNKPKQALHQEEQQHSVDVKAEQVLSEQENNGAAEELLHQQAQQQQQQQEQTQHPMVAPQIALEPQPMHDTKGMPIVVASAEMTTAPADVSELVDVAAAAAAAAAPSSSSAMQTRKGRRT